MVDPAFWSRQRVLLTGHTGFKGTWLALWLELLGAETFALALPPESDRNLFSMLQPFSRLQSRFGDIRDLSVVFNAVMSAKPTIVFHLAAQALVRRSFREPVVTVATNIMGTAHVLDAIRKLDCVKAVVVVSTDKVYRNLDEGRPFSELDCIGGDDPYSASKASAELIVSAWARSFFSFGQPRLATARAGNVVGGGDWSEDRLIPDLWRSKQTGNPVVLRYPDAARPWQHVLDPLSGYLAFAERLAMGADDIPRALNFGPPPTDVLTVAEVAELVLSGLGAKAGWVPASEPQFPEKKRLTLDSTLATRVLGWRPVLSARDALAWTIEWYQRFDSGEDARAVATEEIQRYQSLS